MILIKAHCLNGVSMYKTVKDTLDTHGMAVKWNACLHTELELALLIADLQALSVHLCIHVHSVLR